MNKKEAIGIGHKGPVRYRFFLFLLGDGLQIGVDKAVDLTVHNGGDVSVLVARTGVLGKGVGHKDVRTDLSPT